MPDEPSELPVEPPELSLDFDLSPDFELPLDPELAWEPVDELDEDLVLVLVTAAWLVPGRVTATTPAAATLAKDTVAVVAFSRRRPRARSATLRAS